jgi:hypothetical protein
MQGFLKSIGYLVLQRESVWAEQNVSRGKGGKIKTLTVKKGEEVGKYDVKEGFGNYRCTKNIKT